jgi:hypothetical protein
MGRGQPTKYEPEDLAMVYKYAEAGLTNEQIAALLDVSVRTFYRWMAAYPEFCHALKEEKQFSDSRVEASLYQRAIGYWGIEEKAVSSINGVEIVEVAKFYPPDAASCIFWLKNRQPDRWRQTPENVPAGEDGEITLTIKGNDVRIG